MKRLALLMMVLLTLCGSAFAQDPGFTVTITIDKKVTVPTPVCVPLALRPEAAKLTSVAAEVGKVSVWGQLTAPGLTTEHIKSNTGTRRDLHLVLTADDKIPVGTHTLNFKPLKLGDVYVPEFRWEDTKGRHIDLVFSKSPHEVRSLRYMYQAYDDSTPENRNKSYKVFHHLFDPSGKRLVTNGGHNDNPKVLQKFYPHHRGIQMGFNKCTYGDGKKKADVWHCQKDDHQSHEGFANAEAGYLLGRHRVAVDWHGAGREVFVKEERELTVYKTPGGTLIEFSSRLKPVHGTVKLDGDPQHAGFQFRAHNDVFEKNQKHTYYLRPDGKGKLGETRNWDPKTKKGPVNLPWNALSFVLDDKRYTVCYLDHPNNPRESRHSERDYGRFGCYFEKEITPERPLLLNYRLWLQDGEMTAEQVQALYDSLASPPKTAAK